MDILQRRKICREFLNGYNEKSHPEIISRIFEIGLLAIKNRYNKINFSKEELDDIINELKGDNYVQIIPLPKYNKSKNMVNMEDYYFKTEANNDNENINTNLFDRSLKNPNFTTQKREIYPYWWWNNKEDYKINSITIPNQAHTFEINQVSDIDIKPRAQSIAKNNQKMEKKKLSMGSQKNNEKKNFKKIPKKNIIKNDDRFQENKKAKKMNTNLNSIPRKKYTYINGRIERISDN